MALPLLLWSLTGLVFLIKPGYELAYDQLAPRFYSFDRSIRLPDSGHWSQARLFRTVLGYHLVVLKEGQWMHLDPFTLEAMPKPTPQEISKLVSDAISDRAQRYGSVEEIEGLTVFTDTGVAITLDWTTVSLQQKGRDTQLIEALYRIHYLQWFNSPMFNRLFGALGLGLLVFLALIGLIMVVRKDSSELT